MQGPIVGVSVKVLTAKLVKVPLRPVTRSRPALPVKAALAIAATEGVEAKAQRALAVGAVVARAVHGGGERDLWWGGGAGQRLNDLWWGAWAARNQI